MNQLQTLLLQALRFLTVSKEGMTEQEAKYISAKEQRHYNEAGGSMIGAASAIMLVSAILIFFLSPLPQKYPQSLTHAMTAAFLAMVRAFYARKKFDLRIFVFLAQCLMGFGYASTLRLTFSQNPDVNSVAFLSTIFTALTIFNTTLFPYKNGFVLLTAGLHLALTFYAWSAAPELKPLDWMAVAGTCVAFALAMFYHLVYTARSEWLGELATRQLLSQGQSNRIRSLQRDMAEASELQDSLAPRESIVTSHGLKVSFFQIKYDLLGGDWGAARSLESGELVIAVADATGKGIQAALVIHSIQTLWANALSSPSFDPEAWLHSANKTLIALGQRKEHTMSLGLVIISQQSISYYSAGHLPLLLIVKDGDRRDVQAIPARGSLLGVNADFQLMPRSIPRESLSIEALLLGTDGVFDTHTSFRRQSILELASRLGAKGAAALEECPAQDDKLLVWVQHAA